MRFDKDDIIYEKDQKAREIFISIKGDMVNSMTRRVFSAGQMIG